MDPSLKDPSQKVLLLKVPVTKGPLPQKDPSQNDPIIKVTKAPKAANLKYKKTKIVQELGIFLFTANLIPFSSPFT
jgi:hypothetical protein